MNTKFCCALIYLSLCFGQLIQIQARPNENNDPDVEGIIDRLIEKARQLYEKLKSYVEALIEEAKKILSQLWTQILKIKDAVVEAFKQEVNLIIQRAKDELEDIKREAKNRGVNVTDCEEAMEQSFGYLLTDVITNEKTCVTNEVETAKRLIAAATDSIVDVYNIIVNLSVELEDCIAQRSYTCLSSMIETLVMDGPAIAFEIVQVIRGAENYVNYFSDRLENCAAFAVIEATAKEIAITAEECMQKRMNH